MYYVCVPMCVQVLHAHERSLRAGEGGCLSPGWAVSQGGMAWVERIKAPEEVSLYLRARWAERETGTWDKKKPSHGHPLLSELQGQREVQLF